MNEIERKLANYRAQKESSFYKIKENLGSYFTSDKKEEKEVIDLSNVNDENVNFISNNDYELESLTGSDECDDVSLNCCSYVDWIYYILCFSLWATVYSIFIKLQFGTVFLIASALIGIFINTRTGPKKKGEVSAYSVFNKDCRSIDGTLKAEQFEREIRYGPGMIRS